MKKRVYAIALATTMILTSMLSLVSCGEETLESYIDKNEDIEQSIKAMEYSDENGKVTVSADENVLVITSQYAENMSDEVIKNIKDEKLSVEDQSKEAFESLAASLEASSGIEGISIKVEYLDGSGKQIYSATYE